MSQRKRKRAAVSAPAPQPRMPRINAVGLRDAEEKVERYLTRKPDAAVAVYVQDMLLGIVSADQ